MFKLVNLHSYTDTIYEKCICKLFFLIKEKKTTFESADIDMFSEKKIMSIYRNVEK